MSLAILELAERYGTSERGALCDRILLDVLNTECKPIHYKSEKLRECHLLYRDSQKTGGAAEAVRDRYSSYKNRSGANVIKGGFIYLNDWSRKNALKLNIHPATPLTFNMSALDWEYGVREFITRRNFMYDKGIPDDIRINGLVSEEAVKRILKNYNPCRILDKEHHHIKSHNDHDFRILISNGKIIKVDAKSLQSSYGWNIGKVIKKELLYIFSGPAKNGVIDLYGYQFGHKLIAINNERIKINHINDIRSLLGWLSFNLISDNNQHKAES